jgi:predicted nucleotidyltransferase
MGFSPPDGYGKSSPYRLETIAMDRAQTLQLLATHKSTLADRFGVVKLALFGSTARGRARQDSDVDILVSFDGPATSKRYFGVQFYLEDLLGRPVDLVTDKALRPELRPHIEREAISV